MPHTNPTTPNPNLNYGADVRDDFRGVQVSGGGQMTGHESEDKAVEEKAVGLGLVVTVIEETAVTLVDH